MNMTASKLRENIYQVLDEVLKTGIPIEISRKVEITIAPERRDLLFRNHDQIFMSRIKFITPPPP